MTIYKHPGLTGKLVMTPGGALARNEDCCCPPPEPGPCCDGISFPSELYWESSCDGCEGPTTIGPVTGHGCTWGYGYQAVGPHPSEFCTPTGGSGLRACTLGIACGCGTDPDEMYAAIGTPFPFSHNCPCTAEGVITRHSCDPFHASGTITGPNGSVFVEIYE